MALSWLSKKIFGAEKSENLIQNPPWAPKVVNYRLDQEQCRLLILRETSHGHKSLLYDSSSLKECSGPEKAHDVMINDKPFEIEKCVKKDVKDLAEKIYGTLPIANQSDTIKVNLPKTLVYIYFLQKTLKCFQIHELQDHGMMWSFVFNYWNLQMSPNSLSSFGSKLSSIGKYVLRIIN